MANHKELIVSLVFVLSGLFPSLVLAHSITLTAYAEKDIVYCESFFQDGKPVVDGTLTVAAPDGTIITEGRTNLHGFFQFASPGANDLHITLKTLMGHSNSIVFNGQDQRESTLVKHGAAKSSLFKMLLGVCSIFSLFGIVAYLMSKKK